MRLIKKLNPDKTFISEKKKNNNLKFLLEKRFNWMKQYLRRKKNIIELGSGNGFIKEYLGKNVLTSDIFKNDKINYKIDMNKLNLPKKYKKNVDVFILNHSLHHSKDPINVIHKMKKNLKTNGYILINEPEISLMFKIFLKVFNHENWDTNISNSNTKNFWYENNATGYLLFNNKLINQKFKGLQIKKNELSEFFTFLNSSGNGVRAPHIKLNKFSLNLIYKIDNFLVYILPRIFALNRKVVLKKND